MAFDAAPFQAFVVPRPLLPFHVQGAVQFSYRGETQSGDLTLQALPGPAYRLELRAPVTGALALEVRISPTILLVIDYSNETYILVANTPAMRRRLFEMDVTPEELLTLLTGRVEAARFEAGQGVLRVAASAATGASVERAEFSEHGTQQRFLLDSAGLPSEWTKEADGAPAFRVEFREYLELPQPQGPPLRVPRKVRLYEGPGSARMVIGVREFEPGATDGTSLDLGKLPPAASHFAPGALPDPPR